ncbi:hypothetical protein O6H91_07G092400 [Diphasiastrum complanatum]|uniref:Uncharacterized protein n=2 Tax=Diphasiastrum complanatum TaxID=34168 RepID=A0ACC2D6X8_DIPCM|nr:hypothetical protein O6H91_07G078500 [Diphasiastrum complanatum]KAJ7550284.1 hypothetical protein O6H91_07G092400 [Diphasiastrum complanatum]
MPMNSVLRFIAVFVFSSTLCSYADAKHHTKLKFYMHDNTAPPNVTVVQVARPSANVSSTSFGTVVVIDDLITEGPSPSSKVLGRGQGTYIFDSLSTTSLLLTFTAVFENDVHNGTLSFHGADRVLLKKREIAVVGGTGVFRYVRGYAVMETHTFTYATTVLLFDVTLRR